jgi:T5SS/PEP-CTERM-associated repeat protein
MTPERIYRKNLAWPGGGQSHSNMQPSLALNYIIALQGVFPSRNSGAEPALGEIGIFAGNFAPRGWALCEGQLLSINSNEALFSILGTTYGGDGRTTFALPDLRGRTPIGAGSGAGLTRRNVGQKGGSPIATASEIPSHLHSVSGTAAITGLTGGGASHTNMQPWLAINYVVPLSGIFPSRNLGGESYLGSVELFAGNFAPRPTTLAQGQLLSINQNQSLYSLLGTTYGGDGRTTFALPDLRGRTPIHVGGNPTPYRLGQKLGVENVTLAATELPAHTHTLPGAPGVTEAAGGGQAHTNMQPGLGLNYVIALNGVFPSRSIGQQAFIGEVGLFAGNFAPRSWAFCDGQLLPIASNTALFSILGTIYGGDGRTNFQLPDLRGRSVIGAGNGPGLPSYRLGEKAGADTVTLSSQQMASHNHVLPTNTWTGESGGAWNTESNWTLNKIPTEIHNTQLNNGNTAVLTPGGQQCASLFLGYSAGDIGKLQILQGASLSVTDGAYIGFGGLGMLNLASGGQVSSDTMSIGIDSALRLHVGGDDMVVLGNAGSVGSIANNDLIGLYADAFLAGGSYTPISDLRGLDLTWSGGGTVEAFGGVWHDPSRTFTVLPQTPLNAGVVHSVTSNDRLLITDASSGNRVSVSFADVTGPVDFSASIAENSDQLALEEILPADSSILGAWDFDTTLPDGTEVFLAFDVEDGLANFHVWHLDEGVWSLLDPAFKSFDAIGGIAGFTVDSFSGYAVTVPEPGTLVLLSLGALAALRRRRRRQG